jgi:hypothetical protein
MYTKSIIQQQVELFQAKDNFRRGIESLMEKYTIEDSVFVLSNGKCFEAVDGYFAVVCEYDNLNEAISNCDINTMGIRVMNDTKFQTGTLHNSITECKEDSSVFDLKRLENVR